MAIGKADRQMDDYSPTTLTIPILDFPDPKIFEEKYAVSKKPQKRTDPKLDKSLMFLE